MCSDKPAGSKLNRVITDFPNLAVLTKSTTPGEIQAMYVHTSIRNKFFGEMVTNFVLEGSLEASTVVSIDIERALARNGKKVHYLTTKVLLLAATGKLAKSKKLREWMARNAVLFPPFLTDTALNDRETTVEALLKIFTDRINNQEVENAADELDAEVERRSDAENKKSAKTRSTKDATARDTADGITTNCDNILLFFQAVALKAPRVHAASLSLQAKKRVTGWFCQLEDSNLSVRHPPTRPHPKITPDSRESSVK